MKQILFIFAIVLAFGVFAGSGSAQQQGNRGAVEKTGAAYDPKVIYPGEYKARIVFFRFSHKDFWRRRPRLDRLTRITCQDALNALNQTGLWRGDLNPDGSCRGTHIESPEWATGNRINYDEALQDSAR